VEEDSVMSTFTVLRYWDDVNNEWVPFVAGIPTTTSSNEVNKTPTGALNGTNKVFTLPSSYVGGSLEVWINGLKQVLTTHYTETTPSTGVFTMSDAPLSTDNIICNYQHSLTSTTDADKVDGFHANATPMANTLLPLDSNAKWPISTITGLGLPKLLKIDFNNGTATRSTTTSTTFVAVPGAIGDTSYTAPAGVDVDILFTMTQMINPVSGTATLCLSINGVAYGPSTYQEAAGGTVNWPVQTVTYKYSLNAGQTITIGAVWKISAGTATITNNNTDSSYPNEITGLVIPRN
jgi:hypothetical protein